MTHFLKPLLQTAARKLVRADKYSLTLHLGEILRSSAEGVVIHRLPAGKCAYLIHKGPYEHLSRSYAKIMDYIQKKNYQVLLPIREIYRKGPGMIFRGNPKNYLTEIQIMISHI